MLMRNTCFIDIKNVTVRVSQIVRHAIFVQSVRIFRFFTPKIDHILRERSRLITIGHTFIQVLHIACIIGNYIIRLIQRLERHITRIIQLHFTGFTGFSRNQDNTVGCTGTIDRRWSRILQDTDCFDILRADTIQAAFHTVDNDQRRRVVQSTLTTHLNICISIIGRNIVAGRDLHTGSSTGQSCWNVCQRAAFCHFTDINGCNRTRQVNFFLRTITYNYRNLLFFVSDKWNN